METRGIQELQNNVEMQKLSYICNCMCTKEYLLRPVSLLLLLTLVFNISGYWVIFEVNKAIIYWEIRSGNSIVGEVFCFFEVKDSPDLNVNELENADEFQYQDHWYDILKTEKKDGKIVLYCLNDVREDDLYSAFRKAAQSQASKNLLDHLPDIGLTCKSLTIGNLQPEKIKYFRYTNHLPKVSYQPLSPPPKDLNAG
jgi:hypothetical protein